MHPDEFEPEPMIIILTAKPVIAAAESTENPLAIYALTLYTVASPDPDPDLDTNPWGGGQLSNPNECNSTLMSGTKGIYPYPYI